MSYLIDSVSSRPDIVLYNKLLAKINEITKEVDQKVANANLSYTESSCHSKLLKYIGAKLKLQTDRDLLLGQNKHSL